MNLLAPLAALLGIEAESIIARTRAMIFVYATIAVLSLIAFAFLLAAAYMALSDVLGPINSALIFGGGFLLLALAVYLGAMIGENRHRREVAERRRSSETGAFLTTAALTALPAVLKSPLIVRLGLPAAALAAFAMLRDSKDE